MDSRPPLWAWTGRLSPRTADILIVAVLTFLSLPPIAIDAVRGRGLHSPLLIFGELVLLLVQTVPLYWRRQFPNTVLALVASAFAVKTLLDMNAGVAGLSMLIGTYSVAAYGSGRWRLGAIALAGLAFVSGFVGFAVTGNPHAIVISVPALGFVAAWLAGDYLRTRRAYVGALEERASRLERERELDRQVAADEERSRIARELHDVVAHDVSVIAIQAGAARTVQQAKPEQAAQALGLIETTARKTLVELNQLLGVLRRPNGALPDRGPQPGLSQAAVLLEELRAAGVSVDFAIEGQPMALPPAMDLSAYRILQEAVTNILKHARAHRAEIRVSYSPTTLALFVRDDGVSSSRPSMPPGGHGLIGMGERVALFGGELRAGPRPGGGFEVWASIPLTGA